MNSRTLSFFAVSLMLTAFVCPEAFLQYVSFCWEKKFLTLPLLAVHYWKPVSRWIWWVTRR